MKAVTGIFIVASLLQPMKNIIEKLSDIPDMKYDEAAAFAYRENAVEDYLKMKISEIVCEQANEYNIEIISVKADIIKKEECIIIQKITVIINEADENDLLLFERSVKEQTGVTVNALIK